MLRGIHKATSNWLGKAIMATVMGLLVVSFAIWGIGDIFRGFGLNSVAKVGGTEISIEQFRQYYTDKLQQFGRQIGRAITPDIARTLGLDRQLIAQLIAETTLDEQTRKLHLGLSDADIAQRITNDPSFRGPTGQFDRTRFELLIRNAGFTEGRYVEQERRTILRRQIALSVSGDVQVPQTTLAAINQFTNEKRSIEYIALTAAQAGDVPEPTPEVLSKYFEERKVLFRAPEYRKVTLLALTPADIAKPEAVTDADAKNYYEQRKASFGTPEKRELHQMLFPNEQEAAAARERIVKGASFADIAKERGLKDSDVDLGMVAKSDIVDPTVADAAFSLKSGEVSAPIKGGFGTVLIQVGKIEPGVQKSYDDVAAQIKKEIAEGRARTDLNALRDKIEDERAAGSTLTETGKKLGLKTVEIDAVDRSGRAPDGQPVTTIPKTPDVIGAIFASDPGVDNDALQLPNNGLLWYDVTGVTPSHDRPLDEVKDQVSARWRDDEIGKRLQAKADEMLGKLKAGSALSQVAFEAGLKVETAAGLQRNKPAGFLSAKVVDAAFKTAKDTMAVAEGDTQAQRFVFRVTEVVDPPLDTNAPATKQLSTSLQNAVADDLMGQYVTRLESDYGVSINQQALNQVIGGGTANQ